MLLIENIPVPSAALASPGFTVDVEGIAIVLTVEILGLVIVVVILGVVLTIAMLGVMLAIAVLRLALLVVESKVLVINFDPLPHLLAAVTVIV